MKSKLNSLDYENKFLKNEIVSLGVSKVESTNLIEKVFLFFNYLFYLFYSFYFLLSHLSFLRLFQLFPQIITFFLLTASSRLLSGIDYLTIF